MTFAHVPFEIYFIFKFHAEVHEVENIRQVMQIKQNFSYLCMKSFIHTHRHSSIHFYILFIHFLSAKLSTVSFIIIRLGIHSVIAPLQFPLSLLPPAHSFDKSWNDRQLPLPPPPPRWQVGGANFLARRVTVTIVDNFYTQQPTDHCLSPGWSWA